VACCGEPGEEEEEEEERHGEGGGGGGRDGGGRRRRKRRREGRGREEGAFLPSWVFGGPTLLHRFVEVVVVVLVVVIASIFIPPLSLPIQQMREKAIIYALIGMLFMLGLVFGLLFLQQAHGSWRNLMGKM